MFYSNDHSCDVFANDIRCNSFIFLGAEMLIILTILLLFVYFYLGRKQPAIALVTSPFVAGTMIFIGFADENIAVTAIAPGIFIVTIITILLSKSEADLESRPQSGFL